MTWCSPPLSLYSSSFSVRFHSCLKQVQSTFLIKNGPSKRHSWPQKWETTTIITAQDGNIVRNNLKIWKPLLNSLSPPPKLPFAPSSPVWTSHQGFSFWSGPPLSASLPISLEGPSLFLHMHIHTQRCRAGMPSPSPLAVQLANPWTLGQLRTWTKLASWTTDSTMHHQETRKTWTVLWKVWYITGCLILYEIPSVASITFLDSPSQHVASQMSGGGILHTLIWGHRAQGLSSIHPHQYE